MSQNHQMVSGRHRIERTRLLRALDAAEGPLILLIAPAGYGKTTLARQWLDSSGKPTIWVRATPAAADVMALARTIADAADTLIPGIQAAMMSRLQGTRTPEAEAEAIGTFMADMFASWPKNAWLALDDAHLISASDSSSGFLQALFEAERTNLRAVIMSRRRPTWLPARRAVYGEVAEFHQADLAFDEAEVRALARDVGAADCEALMRVSRGWPAVVSLAARNRTGQWPVELPASLYEYFAEELFRECSSRLQEMLLRLAILPQIDLELIDDLFGEGSADEMAAGTQGGLLSFDASLGYEIHPLLRSFLHTKLRLEPSSSSIASSICASLLARQRWDDAFEVIQTFGLVDQLPVLFEAQQMLLAEGRLTMLERWVNYASSQGATFPLLDLAEGEISRRKGHMAAGHSLALQAVRTLGEQIAFLSQAYSLAGECVYSDRPQLSFNYYREAERHAVSHADKVRSIWGQLTLASDLPEAESDFVAALDRLNQMRNGDPNLELRVASAATIIAFVSGGVRDSLHDVEWAEPLVSRATDPLARTHFYYQLSYLKTMIGHYREAAAFAETALEDAATMRLDSVQPHLLAVRAASLLGSRQLHRAEMTLETTAAIAERLNDSFEILNVRAIRARIEIARRRFDAADRALPLTAIVTRSRALRGECLGLRALISALQGDHVSARLHASSAVSETHDVQARCFASLTNAVIALSTEDPSTARCLMRLKSVLSETQIVDPLVVTYRGFPRLVEAIKHDLQLPNLADVLKRSNDGVIARQFGIDLPNTGAGKRGLLTPREREVLELICGGLTNREIASRLYITESTAKLHVRHILGKLGVRSRTEAALAAGSDQL